MSDDDDRKTILAKHLSPRYGGIPVELNQILEQARAEGDTEKEAEVHNLRIAHFKNRRNPAQKAAREAAGRKKFIAKYGVAGELALKKTDTRRKLKAMTPEERLQWIQQFKSESKVTEGNLPSPAVAPILTPPTPPIQYLQVIPTQPIAQIPPFDPSIVKSKPKEDK